MNVIQVGFWELVSMAGSLILLMAGGGWVFVKLIVHQFSAGLDQRFAGQDELRKQREKALDIRFNSLERSISEEAEAWRKIERELLELKAALPNQYLRREDAIRQEVVIHSKLDALAAKIDALRVGG